MAQEKPIVVQEATPINIPQPQTSRVLGVQRTADAIVVTSEQNGKQIVNIILVNEVKLLIDNAIQKIIPRLGFKAVIVSELPLHGEFGYIYLVAKEGESDDVYNEYIWVLEEGDDVGQWEFLGNSSIDLTNYYTKSEINAMFVTLTQEQYDALVSGGTVNPDTYYFIEEE